MQQAGAADEATYERWHAHWLRPAERVGRVITPGYGECAARRVWSSVCLRHGTLHYDLIARVLPGLKYAPPFP